MGPQLHKRLPREAVAEILAAFNDGHLSEEQACTLLGVKRTRLYELRKEWLKARPHGDFQPRRVRKMPGRSLPPAIEAFLHEELRYLRDEAQAFRGRFNFAVMAEAVERKFERRMHRNSVRRFALRHGYYHQLPEETRKVYIRFESAGPGALYQHDTSRHVWLPGTGCYQDLILTQDDYSRKVVWAQLLERETAWAHLCAVRTTLTRYGRPLAYYVDQHSFFRFVAHRGVHVTYRLGEDEGNVQFRRALLAVEVGVIYARRAQAKGKIEKRFDYFQRRLPPLCERYRIHNVTEAAPLLDELVGYYNERRVHAETGEIPEERWTRGVREGRSRLRSLPADTDLDVIFSLQVTRKVRPDGTIQFGGRVWPIGRLAGRQVVVCFQPDQRLIVLHEGRRIGDYRL